MIESEIIARFGEPQPVSGEIAAAIEYGESLGLSHGETVAALQAAAEEEVDRALAEHQAAARAGFVHEPGEALWTFSAARVRPVLRSIGRTRRRPLRLARPQRRPRARSRRTSTRGRARAPDDDGAGGDDDPDLVSRAAAEGLGGGQAPRQDPRRLDRGPALTGGAVSPREVAIRDLLREAARLDEVARRRELANDTAGRARAVRAAEAARRAAAILVKRRAA